MSEKLNVIVRRCVFCYNNKIYTVREREKRGDIIKDLYIFLLLMIENVNFHSINMQLCCARVIGGVNCKLCYCTEGRFSQVERKHLCFLCIEWINTEWNWIFRSHGHSIKIRKILFHLFHINNHWFLLVMIPKSIFIFYFFFHSLELWIFMVHDSVFFFFFFCCTYILT